jgi:hypothetical protein
MVTAHVNSGAAVESLMRIFHDSKITCRRTWAIGVYGQSVIVRKHHGAHDDPQRRKLEEQIG